MDSWQLLHELQNLPPLPPNAICYTAHAVLMYTNIANEHGIAMIGWWLKLLCSSLPTAFPSQNIFWKVLTS
jgi:hypothetical protein